MSRAFPLLTTLILLLAACAPGKPSATLPPPAAPTLSATGTPTPLSLVVSTYYPSPTPTITPLPSPTPLPTVETRQECITFEDHLPADLRPGGILFLAFESWDGFQAVARDLDQMTRPDFPSINIMEADFALSPDARWIADWESGLHAQGDSTGMVLRITNAEGQQRSVSFVAGDRPKLVGWADESHLVVEVPGNHPENFLKLNPFTGEKEELWFDPPTTFYTNGIFFNPALTRWINITNEETPRLLLMDDQWKILWTGRRRSLSAPLWSPDGQSLAVVHDASKTNVIQVNTLLRIGPDGKATQLTNRIGDYANISWSPDGRFLAGWLNLNTDVIVIQSPNNLALIDVEKPLITDLCFENEKDKTSDEIENYYRPVWSPDGRFLAIAVSRNGEYISPNGDSYEGIVWDTAIVDLQTYHAYRMDEGSVPLAWMRKP